MPEPTSELRVPPSAPPGPADGPDAPREAARAGLAERALGGGGAAAAPARLSNPPNDGQVSLDSGPSSLSREGLERQLGRVGSAKWARRIGIAVGVFVLALTITIWRVKVRPPPASRYVTAQTSLGDITEIVQSTGQIKPLTEVQVGAQVSGRVARVFVDFNSQVKAGDVLAEIDPTLFGAAIDSNQAQLAAQQASVKRSEANLTTAKQKVDRAKKLVSEGIGSQADMETAQGAYDVALAELAASKAQIGQIAATLRSSKTNMEYTRIFSPIDGLVINRAIDPGQTVAASFQAPTLFVIAQDLRKMRVLADIDEADVGRLKENMAAEIGVDAFPGEKFGGKVSQIRFSPEVQSGVVTYAAVVEVDNPDIKLRPGMTATVTVRSAEVKGVLRIPNAALRYKPSPPKDKEGKPIPVDPLPSLPPHKARVWVVTDERPGSEKVEMRVVDIGVSDGINTELKTDIGPLKVVTDEADDSSKKHKTSFF